MPWPKIHPKRIDLMGRRFGRWLVVGYVPRGDNPAHWRVLCDCGNIGIVKSAVLRDGRSKSCGCLNKELARQRIKHGHNRKGERSPEYKVWSGMRSRCNNKKHKLYEYYGGRGIKICDRWNGPDGFANFLRDMGPRPSLKHSIERVKNDKGYSPKNCCWATHPEQMRNTRQTRFVVFRGKRMCLSDAARAAGLSYKAVHSRIKRGWLVERALSTPSNVDKRIQQLCELLMEARRALTSKHAVLIVKIERALGVGK